jgi:hypothetical protein
MSLSNEERLNLKKMLDQSDSVNNTDTIRKLKHSIKLRDDIRRIDTIRKSQTFDNQADFIEHCKVECPFLYNNYTDIFNKLLKDELDLLIMTKLLTVLKLIEDDRVDQHEGSVMVGKILKELYVDSAMKRADNLDKEHGVMEKEPPNEGISISWKQFKMTRE